MHSTGKTQNTIEQCSICERVFRIMRFLFSFYFWKIFTVSCRLPNNSRYLDRPDNLLTLSSHFPFHPENLLLTNKMVRKLKHFLAFRCEPYNLSIVFESNEWSFLGSRMECSKLQTASRRMLKLESEPQTSANTTLSTATNDEKDEL